MSKNNVGTMVIRFVDGTQEVLEHDRPPQDDVNLAGRIREALDAQHLIIEVDKKMVVYPFHNIKAIEVFPVPEKLPRFAIKKAHLAPSRSK
jgi:hypothetical protein